MMHQLKLIEDPPPAGAAPAWNALDEEQKAKVVARLARIIAQAVVELETEPQQKENRHE
jgi:hypothetical protein